MNTRTSHRWRCKPGSFDSLNTSFIDFDSYPIVGSVHLLNDKIQPVNCTRYKEANLSSILNMFVDDYRLERFWKKVTYYTNQFKRIGYVMTPDFSLLIGMPIEMLQWQVYRNRLLGYVYEKNNIKVIPTVSWACNESLKFCTKGIRKNSTIAVSNVGAKTDDQIEVFNKGLQSVIDIIQPEQVVLCSNKRYRHLYSDNLYYHINPFGDDLRSKIKKSGR